MSRETLGFQIVKANSIF